MPSAAQPYSNGTTIRNGTMIVRHENNFQYISAGTEMSVQMGYNCVVNVSFFSRQGNRVVVNKLSQLHLV